MKNIFKLYSLFLVLVFLISACSIQESWNDFFDFLDEQYDNFTLDQEAKLFGSFSNKKSKPAGLSEDGKQKINAWIKEKGLNQFGDSIDTEYAGGSPLFDEVAEESIDRFQYLLDKYPNLLNEIK